MESFAKRLDIDGQQARYYQLTDIPRAPQNRHLPSRKAAHFYGGNGFTVGGYLPLLTELSTQFDISALALRGYWYDKLRAKTITREQDADWLIAFLERTQDAPVVGIGHSQGATATAIAAAKRPDLFSHLYLIEPVTFTKAQVMFYDWLPRALKVGREPFKSTIAKQTTWNSVSDFYEYLRPQRAFRRISDAHLYTFAKNSLQPQLDGSYVLMFSPDQELANYCGTPYVDKALQQLRCPYTLIVGKPTLFVSDKVRQHWQTFIPDERITVLPEYGHLLPMEAPTQCAQLIIADDTAHHKAA